ncbi:MAG: hypothetical protein Q9181_004427, partial [Wetmoreana brouardii]
MAKFLRLSCADQVSEVKLKQLAYPASKEPGKPDANIAFWPVEILQVPALGLVKSSFVLLYRRIFTKGTAPTFNVVSGAVLALVVSWAVAFFFALVFICGTDFSAYWISTTVEKARCVDTNMLHNAFAISDFLTDLVVILLPLPMIWRLHLTTRRKLGLCAIFGLGTLTVGASIVRMVVFLQATSVQFNPDADFECVQSIVRSVRSAISLHSRSSPKNSAQRSKLSPQHSQECIVTNAEGPAASDEHDLEMGPKPQH